MFRHGMSLLPAVPLAGGSLAVPSITGNLTLHSAIGNLTVPTAVRASPSQYSDLSAYFAVLSGLSCRDLPTPTTQASAAYPTEWLNPFETLYSLPINAACLSVLTASAASSQSSSCKEISSKLSSNPLPSPPPEFINYYTTFSASDTVCASSWYTWLSEYGVKTNWNRVERWCTRWDTTITNTYPITSAATTTLCDGIPRVSHSTLGYTTVTYTIDDLNKLDAPVLLSMGAGYTIGLRQASVKREYARIRPPPLCRLKDQDCGNGWKAIDDNHFYDLVPKEFDGIELFGCAPPSTRCRILGKCAFGAGEFKLIYFEPGVTSSDLCGRDGHGSYYTRPPEYGPPQVQTLSAITFKKDLGRPLDAEEHVIQGPYTFTSGDFYLAYVGVQAMDVCSKVGQTTSASGVIKVPLSQLTTMLRRPNSATWSGSDLEIAKSVAAGKLELPISVLTFAANGTGWRRYWSTNNVHWQATSRSLNIADLQGPVPAANYFMQPNLDCLHGNCSTITEGNYAYEFAMPATFLELDPAWAECATDGWIRDPPMVLSTTTRNGPPAPFWASIPGAGAGHGAAGGIVLSTTTRHAPAAPFWAQSPGDRVETRVRASQAQATPGQFIAAVTPIATAKAPIATITMHAQAFSKDGAPLGTIEVVMDGEVSPGERVDLDNGIQAQAQAAHDHLDQANDIGSQGTAVDRATGTRPAVLLYSSTIGIRGDSDPIAVAPFTNAGYASYKYSGYTGQLAGSYSGQGQQSPADIQDVSDGLSRSASSATEKWSVPVPSQSTRVQSSIVSTSSKSGATRRVRTKLIPWQFLVHVWRMVIGGWH